jgi:hypothetical protein
MLESVRYAIKKANSELPEGGVTLSYVQGCLESGRYTYAGKEYGYNAWNHKGCYDPARRLKKW